MLPTEYSINVLICYDNKIMNISPYFFKFTCLKQVEIKCRRFVSDYKFHNHFNPIIQKDKCLIISRHFYLSPYHDKNTRVDDNPHIRYNMTSMVQTENCPIYELFFSICYKGIQIKTATFDVPIRDILL